METSPRWSVGLRKCLVGSLLYVYSFKLRSDFYQRLDCLSLPVLPSSSLTAFTDFCPDRFFWATRFLFLIFRYFFVFCLSWSYRQLLSARKYIVSYCLVLLSVRLSVPLAHTQRDLSEFSTSRRGQRKFLSEYYEDRHTCSFYGIK